MVAGCQLISGLDDYGIAPPPTEPHIDSVWSKSYGGALIDGGNHVAIDGADNVIVVGAFESPIDFGGGTITPAGRDAFVLKLDRDGNYVWARVFIGPNDDSALQVTVDSQNELLVAGLFTEEIDFGTGDVYTGPPGQRSLYLVKLDADGAAIWARAFVGFTTPFIPRVAIGADGSILLTGGLRGTVDFGGGPVASSGARDYFVVKLTADGDHVWTRTFASSPTMPDPSFAPSPVGLEVDVDGSVLLAGFYLESIDILGTVFTGPATVPRTWVARLDPDGNPPVWAKAFGADIACVATTTSLGGDQLLVAGSFIGTLDVDGDLYQVSALGNADVYIARFDKELGDHLGTKTYQATLIPPVMEATSVVSMDVNDSGDVLIVGKLIDQLVLGGTTLTAIGQRETDLFAAKLAADGTPLLAARYGDDKRQLAVGGELDSAGNVLVTGSFQGQLLLGAERHVSQGADDIFVVKLVP